MLALAGALGNEDMRALAEEELASGLSTDTSATQGKLRPEEVAALFCSFVENRQPEEVLPSCRMRQREDCIAKKANHLILIQGRPDIGHPQRRAALCETPSFNGGVMLLMVERLDALTWGPGHHPS